ncbi:IS3 family transposase [Acinetobacter sp. SwsAc5]
MRIKVKLKRLSPVQYRNQSLKAALSNRLILGLIRWMACCRRFT